MNRVDVKKLLERAVETAKDMRANAEFLDAAMKYVATPDVIIRANGVGDLYLIANLLDETTRRMREAQRVVKECGRELWGKDAVEAGVETVD
jgi:hypothetical protein